MSSSDLISPTASSFWFRTLGEDQQRELTPSIDTPVLEEPDVLILDDGIVGLAIGYFAAERGLKVQIVTSEDVLATDSQDSLGVVAPNSTRWSFVAETQGLGQASRDWWAKLAVRPEFQTDWRVSGAIIVDEGRLTPSPRQQMMAALEEGYSVFSIDAEQVAGMETHLRSCPVGALHLPSEAILHPLKAACGFVRGLLKHQGRITRLTASVKCQTGANRSLLIETTSGIIRPRWVIANRARSTALQELAGTDPIPSTIRYQAVFATESCDPLLLHPVLAQDWLIQWRSGHILTACQSPLPLELDQIQRNIAAEQLQHWLPSAPQVEFTGAYRTAGHFRSAGLPRFGFVAGMDRTLEYDGFGFDSLLFAPQIGKLTADWMTSGLCPDDLAFLEGGTQP